MNYYSQGSQRYNRGNYPPNITRNNRANYMSHTPQCQSDTRAYIVVPGDSLYSIANRYGVTVDDIMMNNPQITDPALIYIGQVICIPCNGMIYIIKPSDTLYSIAMSYSLTIDEILAVNPEITNPNLIYPGQKICLPYDSTCPQGFESYIIQPMDNLVDILTNTSVSLNTLKGANPGFDEKNIIPGTQLCVIPTPCKPPCEIDTQTIIPDGVIGVVAVAEYYTVSANDLLSYNPNYPPCYYVPGHTICLPPAVPV